MAAKFTRWWNNYHKESQKLQKAAWALQSSRLCQIQSEVNARNQPSLDFAKDGFLSVKPDRKRL